MTAEKKHRVPSDNVEWGDKARDHWRILLSENIHIVMGEDALEDLVPNFDPDEEYSEEENIEWTAEAMERLDECLEEVDRIEILTRCAHQIPDEFLDDLRRVWKETESVDDLHRYWQRRFLDNLEKWAGDIPNEWKEVIIENYWGEAGRKEDNVVVATKIPSNMKGYFESDDPREKRYHYCHCPRIRSVVLSDENEISPTYCYCGGGFYKSNWERVIGRPVRVELMESVLRGDDVCKFRIILPEGL
ncbi:MAG: hypothetical protein GKC03_02405 [Methanomassiliicoccales archaeon]|nr:hypothetical protein [Methanomassiliicoccales archaeon]NYT14943.1 hypothetical protein [Methanomassiliicoccales archaeon]